ncbi:MAG: nucleoprotein/polynucleotide-associated enzyme [Cycloclasticus sp.]|nr:MAG: nucleoprotein/polynucleotide-associated enzyme [Cycloclasticus sp.]
MKNISLQDQLLKAGLTNKTKASKVKSQKHKQLQKKRKNKIKTVDETALLAKQAEDQRREKDKLLNEKRNQKAEKKQIAGQIKQLIMLNKFEKDDEGTAFNFTHNDKVKSVYVSDELRNRLVAGRAVIVQLAKAYEVVPAPVAEKIAQRDQQRVIYLDDVVPVVDEYADYQIPDDLMW